MANIISNTINGVIQKIKASNDEYSKLQRIKNTPQNLRTKAQTNYADKANKTKRSSKSNIYR